MSAGMRCDDLTVSWLTLEQHRNTCGYWFTVQSRGTAHTAFATRAGLDRYLSERGLAIDGELAQGSWRPILGHYFRKMHLTPEHVDGNQSLAELDGLRTRTLSNGHYVVAVITADENAIRTVHTLNPNVRERVTFDYRESRAMMS